MKIDFTQTILANQETVLALLLDHNNLHRFFNANISVLQQQDKGEIAGGKGTIRQIKSAVITFQEQILSVTADHISYKIIGKAPVSNHQGDIYLSEENTSHEKSTTSVHYVITCQGPRWLPEFMAKFFVEKDIKQAMKKLALFCK